MTSDLEVQKISKVPVDDSYWKEASSEECTIFQTPEWIKIEKKRDQVQNKSLKITLGNGKKAILPLVEEKFQEGWRSKVGTVQIGAGNGVYTGLISNEELSAEEREKMKNKAVKEVKKGIRPKVISIPLKPDRIGDNFTQIVDTSPKFEEMLSKHNESGRRCFRQAERNEDLKIEKNPHDAVERFFSLYQNNLERWDDPNNVYTREFFESIYTDLEDEKREFKLVVHKDEGDIGALLSLKHDKHSYMFMNCMDYNNRDYYPNNYSITSTLKELAESDIEKYDLGASSGINGLIEFKKSFGSEKVNFSSYKLLNSSFNHLRRIKDIGKIFTGT